MHVCVCVFVREYCRLKFAACCHSKPWAISASLLNSLRGDGRWCREKSNRGVAWHQACFALLTVTWLFQCIGPLLRMELKGTMPWRESTSIKSRTTTTRQRCHWDWKCELQDVERAIHPAGFHSAGRFRNDMPRLQAPQILMCNSPCRHISCACESKAQHSSNWTSMRLQSKQNAFWRGKASKRDVIQCPFAIIRRHRARTLLKGDNIYPYYIEAMPSLESLANMFKRLWIFVLGGKTRHLQRCDWRRLWA